MRNCNKRNPSDKKKHENRSFLFNLQLLSTAQSKTGNGVTVLLYRRESFWRISVTIIDRRSLRLIQIVCTL